jgi:RNA polymerase sigma-70 factor, ECF subfamily
MTSEWNGIVVEHGRMVIQTAMRVLGNAADAEDVAQEVFLEAIAGKPITHVRNWGAYLGRLSDFRALDRRRRYRQELPHTLESLATLDGLPFDGALRRELAEHLRSAIAALPEREGAVFALRYLDRLSIPRLPRFWGSNWLPGARFGIPDAGFLLIGWRDSDRHHGRGILETQTGRSSTDPHRIGRTAAGVDRSASDRRTPLAG